jgi:molybdopterin converting factor small subunit
MATIKIPLLLKDLTGGARQVEVTGATLAEIIGALDAIYPGIEGRMVNGQRISPHLAFVVDGKLAAQGLATPIRPDSRVSILPAFGGG